MQVLHKSSTMDGILVFVYGGACIITVSCFNVMLISTLVLSHCVNVQYSIAIEKSEFQIWKFSVMMAGHFLCRKSSIQVSMFLEKVKNLFPTNHFYPTKTGIQLSCLSRCFKVYFGASRPCAGESEEADRWR